MQFLKEALNGFVEARIYGKIDFFLQRYSIWQRKLNSHLSDIQAAQAMPNRMIEIFAVAGLFILIAINKWAGNINSTTIVNIGAFMAAVYKIMPAAVQILNSNSQVNAYAFAVNDLVHIQSADNACRIAKPTTPIITVSFRNICFQYEHQKIVHDFNACMKKGDFIGN